jgi:hypothetical protein
LQGKIVLVTGGDSGIACAVGVHFSAEGATVAFAHVPRGEDTIQLLKEYKTPAAYDPLKIATDFGFDHNCRKVTTKKINSSEQSSPPLPNSHKLISKTFLWNLKPLDFPILPELSGTRF